MSPEEFLKSHSQDHLLPYLSDPIRSQLARYPESIPIPTAPPQKIASDLLQKVPPLPKTTTPLANTATLILAAGAGSRLNTSRPKGCYPISPVKQKSLFQLICERTLAAQKAYNTTIPLAFLVTGNTLPFIKNFFKKHDCFGLNPDQISLLPQSTLPYYNQERKWFLNSPTHLAEGPSGNGELFRTLQTSGYLSRLKKQKITHLTIAPIDNPLADPFHPSLLTEADISLLCFRREHEERVGVLTTDHTIIDYPQLKEHPAGGLANINIFAFSLPFLERFDPTKLPLHWIEKQATAFDPKTQKETRIDIFKGETFITDSLAQATSVQPFLIERDDYFAPLKTPESVALVQTAIYRKNRDILAALTGTAPRRKVELSMDFYYPTKELEQKLQGKPLPEQDYLTPESF